VSDCAYTGFLVPNTLFIGENKLLLDETIVYLLCTRRTDRLDFYSVTSLKQQSTCRHHALQSDAI